MKILTKKKQKELMNNILDLYNFGSDALKAIGTHQTDKFDAMQALIRQKRITEAAMNAADILQGLFGTRLIMEVDKKKHLLELRDGFPLKLKDATGVCMYSKDDYTDEDRKSLCDGCEEVCWFNQEVQPASEEKSGVVKADLQVYLDDGTWVDLDPAMQQTPAFDVKPGDRVKITVTRE